MDKSVAPLSILKGGQRRHKPQSIARREELALRSGPLDCGNLSSSLPKSLFLRAKGLIP